MDSANDLDRFWDTAAGVLLWCFVFSIAVLLLWWVLLVLFGNWVYAVHTYFFEISRNQFDVVHYAGMALLKIGAFGLFLFPFLGIKLVQRKRKQ